jgi:hypothetical protein
VVTEGVIRLEPHGFEIALTDIYGV